MSETADWIEISRRLGLSNEDYIDFWDDGSVTLDGRYTKADLEKIVAEMDRLADA